MNAPDDYPPQLYAPHPYVQWDAAYVLGALSPGERREFEEHLATCSTCQTAVSELAGLPGLLAQVPPADVHTSPADEEDPIGPPPDTLMPAMITDLRARRRTVRRVVIGVAAALAILVGVLGVLGLRGALPFGGPSEPFRVAFSPVNASALTAVADIVPLDHGTTIRLECQYGESNEPTTGHAYDRYGIYVIARSGEEYLTKDWTAKPNRVMRPEGMTTLRINQIRRVEVRDLTNDQVVLRTSLR